MFHYADLYKRVESLGYTADVAEAVVSAAVAIDRHQLSEDDQAVVYELISGIGKDKLAALPERLLEGRWEPFNYGNVKVGDYVRVKKNAYDSLTGSKHNGLVGVLTHAAGGRFYVSYVGERAGEAHSHPEQSLESLVWV